MLALSATMGIMPAVHIRDVPEETLAAIKRRAARRGHSVQQELREALETLAAEPVPGARPRALRLHTVATGRSDNFDRADFYDADDADLPALIVVDTTVLLAATDESRAVHATATRFLDHDARRHAVTPQIVREYLAVATRPLDANGLGLAGAAACANVDMLLQDMTLLPEDVTSVRHLKELMAHGSVTGKQVHDATIVAVALGGHASTIVTDNTRHFVRFSDLIAVETLEPGTADGRTR